MADILEACRLAIGLLLGPDPTLLRVVGLSLTVSASATLIAAATGLPLGAALAVLRFPGRRAFILLANALLGLPPVVVGLILYLLLSRSGPFGGLGLLFTPSAMVMAQILLALPIVTALAHRSLEGIWKEYGPALQVDGASPLGRSPTYWQSVRPSFLRPSLLVSDGRSLRWARSSSWVGTSPDIPGR